MLKQSWSLFLIAIVVVVLTAFTIREAVAITLIRSDSKTPLKCASLPSRHSIHTEYDEDAGTWIISTEDGPTGVDGGLVDLLAGYRTCSR